MNSRIFYYIQYTRIFDGNDVRWVNRDGTMVYDLRNADMYSSVERDSILCGRTELKAYEAHKVNRLIQMHVPLIKIAGKRGPKIKPTHGELCYILCTRDTVGTNAGFWRWDHKGYTCDIRAAQVVKYDENSQFSDRSIDILVPVKHVNKHIQFRIDCQDLTENFRSMPWVMEGNFFQES